MQHFTNFFQRLKASFPTQVHYYPLFPGYRYALLCFPNLSFRWSMIQEAGQQQFGLYSYFVQLWQSPWPLSDFFFSMAHV